MQPALHHVAQLNIGQLLHPLNDPRTAGFADNTDRVNALAERSKGFLWRCVDEAATLVAEGIELYGGDPRAIATLSLWETAEDLEAFVLRTLHSKFLGRRSEWFRPQDHRTYVIWPVPTGARPDFRTGLERLARLQAEGPGDAAYDFAYLRQAGRSEAPAS